MVYKSLQIHNKNCTATFPTNTLIMPFQFVHVPLSNPPFLQSSAWLPVQTGPCCSTTSLSIKRQWVWLVYSTFYEWLMGQTALGLLIPAQGATWPILSELNWSLWEEVTAPVATPKIKSIAFSTCCRGRWGFPGQLRQLESQPLHAVRRHHYLEVGCYFVLLSWPTGTWNRLAFFLF